MPNFKEHCFGKIKQHMTLEAERLLPPAPIYYHKLHFPTNCYDPWSLRAFVKMLAEDIGKPEDNPKAPDQRVWPIGVDGHITTEGHKIDGKSRCVAMVIYTPRELRQFLNEWPTIPWSMALGLNEGSLAAQALEGIEAVYMTHDLAHVVLEVLDHKEEGE